MDNGQVPQASREPHLGDVGDQLGKLVQRLSALGVDVRQVRDALLGPRPEPGGTERNIASPDGVIGQLGAGLHVAHAIVDDIERTVRQVGVAAQAFGIERAEKEYREPLLRAPESIRGGSSPVLGRLY